MVYGDKGGAIGFLIGEEHKGMQCMFTMMNRARLAVGLQGVAIAERALQQAMAYARERKQMGHAIIDYPDVKRMLLTMRAMTGAARAICYATGVSLDRSIRSKTDGRAQDGERTCLTADAGRESLLHRYRHRGCVARRAGAWRHGLHRGDRRGAALSRRAHRRDLRRHQRHSGGRSGDAQDCLLDNGNTVAAYIKELRTTVSAVKASNAPAFGETAKLLGEAVDSLERATVWLLAQKSSPDALAGATPYLRLFGNAAGGCMLADQALAALRDNGDAAARTALARFFAENVAVQASGLERSVTEGAQSITNAEAALA